MSSSQSLEKCPKMLKNVQKCPKMSKNVEKCSKMYKNVQKCPKMFKKGPTKRGARSNTDLLGSVWDPQCLKTKLETPQSHSKVKK